MSITEETRRGTHSERVVLRPGQATTVEGDGGPVVLRALDDGTIRVEHSGPAGRVLLRIREAIELYDGDLVCAGRQWMSFHAGRDGRPGRLCLLDGDGGIHMAITLRTSALSLGREVGDVVLPWDETLAELHLQLLVRREGTFVQDLASAGTWVVVQPGEALPAGSQVAVGERLLWLGSGGGAEHEDTVVDRGWETAVQAA